MGVGEDQDWFHGRAHKSRARGTGDGGGVKCVSVAGGETGEGSRGLVSEGYLFLVKK